MAASMVQAVYMKLPTNVSKFQTSQVSSFMPPTFNPTAAASISSLRCRFSSVGIHNRNSFAVRAESEAEGTTDDAGDVVEEDVADESAAVAVVDKPPPKKPIVKLGDIMGILNKQAIEATETLRPVPDLRTGDIIEIKLEVPENRRRLSIYKGIIISRQNAGIHTTIRIRRIIAGVGVEIVFPIYSPNIKEIKVVKHRKVRRARLYYLRDKLPRLSTFK